jgi:NADH-quinone oxidoreductase subunit G
VLNDILSGKHKMAKALKAAQRPMIIIGQGALVREDSAALLKVVHDICDKFDVVSEDWNGYNVIHTAAARVGALDLGLTTKGGIQAIIEDVKAGNIDVVFNLGADEMDCESLKEAFVIYQGSHGDQGAQHADVVLPGSAYTEKTALYVNMEGRVQQAQQAAFPPGDAKEDWVIIRALSEKLGVTLNFDTIADLRAQLIKEYPHFKQLDTCAHEAWADFGQQGVLSSKSLCPYVDDYYQTNPIARASKVMAQCSEAFGAPIDLKEAVNG